MTDIHPWLLGAALATSATFLIHVLIGGREFAAPLLRSELPSAVRHTLYYAWHLVSASLALMAGAFAWAAVASEARAAAIIATAMAGMFLGVNLLQTLAMRLSFAQHPQWVFFLTVTLLGGAGLAEG